MTPVGEVKLPGGNPATDDGCRRQGFIRVWAAYAVSMAGSAVSLGALPLIALKALDATALQVSLMAALAAVASAVIALPLASVIEQQPKRRVMLLAEWVQFASLGFVVATYLTDALTVAHLYVAAVVQSAGTIVYLAAFTSFVKNVVSGEDLVKANSRIEATNWTTLTLGPLVGGLLIAWVGIVSSIAIDAVSFAVAAILLLTIPTRHEATISPSVVAERRSRISAGLRFISGHRSLRGLYLNAMMFGGAVMMTSPLLAVLMVRDLVLTPWQYGLVLGMPALAGLLGSLLSPRIVARFGEERALLWAGAARGPWVLLLLAAPSGLGGLVIVMASQSLLLFTAGVFNPIFSTHRMKVTRDDLMSRVTAACSASSKIIQPACILAGGWLAAATNIHVAIMAAGLLCLASGILRPWRLALAPIAEQPRPQPE